MKRSKKFEKQASAIAISKLRASPKLWQIYLRQQSSWWLKLMMIIGLITVIVGTVFVLIVLPIRAGQAVVDRDEAVAFGTASLVTAVAVAIALAHGSWLITELLASRSVAIVAHLPLSDSQYLAHKSKRMCGAMGLMVVPSLSFFGGIASEIHKPFFSREVATVLAMGGLEWVVCLSLTFMVVGWIPRWATSGTVAKFVSWGVLGFMSAAFASKFINIKTSGTVLMAILPTGWPLLMLRYGLTGQEPRIWLLMLGVLVLVLLAWRGYRRMEARYVLAEISFSESATAVVVLAPQHVGSDSVKDFESSEEITIDETDLLHDVLPREVPAIRRLVNWLTFARDAGCVIELSAEAARAKIRTREFLRPAEWQRTGWLERSCARIYGTREEWLVELLTGGDPRWSYRMGVLQAESLCGLGVLLGLAHLFGRGILGLSGHLLLATIIGILKSSWPAAVWRNKAGEISSVVGILPVSPTELNRLQMVLGVMRGVMLLPVGLALAALALFGIMGRVDPVFAARLAVKSILVMVALHQWWPVVLLPHSHSRPWWRYLTDAIPVVFLAVVFIAGGIGLFVAGDSEPWSLVASVGLFGSGWTLHAWVQRRLLKGPTDFVMAARNDHLRAAQAQKAAQPTW